MIDLHAHSFHSDGTETPRQLIERAAAARLSAFAVTDHDTAAGQDEALQAGGREGVRVISGVELTCDFRGGHVHILGYGFDIRHRELLRALARRAAQRRENFYEKVNMANKRLKDAGRGALDADELLKNIQGSPGRPHIAYAIVEKGWAKTFRAAFDAYLLDYVPRTPAFGVEEGIGLVHDAGGIAVIAHPGSNEIGLRRFAKNERDEREAFEELRAKGLDGVEAYTPAHIKGRPSTSSGNNYPLSDPAAAGESKGFSDSNLIYCYLKLAQELNLIVTGGTDWHGPSFDAPAPGEFEVPDEIMNAFNR